MNVLCTSDEAQISELTGVAVNWLQLYEKYTVVRIIAPANRPDRISYVLAEFGPRVAFGSEFFTPLDGPDEIDIARERIMADAAAENVRCVDAVFIEEEGGV